MSGMGLTSLAEERPPDTGKSPNVRGFELRRRVVLDSATSGGHADPNTARADPRAAAPVDQAVVPFLSWMTLLLVGGVRQLRSARA